MTIPPRFFGAGFSATAAFYKREVVCFEKFVLLNKFVLVDKKVLLIFPPVKSRKRYVQYK